MHQTRKTDRPRRFIQQIADLAAVAQARYSERVTEERRRLGRAGRRSDDQADGCSGVPILSNSAAAAAGEDVGQSAGAPELNVRAPGRQSSGEGSDRHYESREKIGDRAAEPAPPAPNAPPEPCRDHVVPHGTLASFKELFRRFGKDQCGAYAAALSFFSILSIVPMLVVALAALAFLFPSPGEAMQHLQKLIAGILPGSAAGKTAQDIMGQAHVEQSVTNLIETRGIAGLIGLLSLIWASMQIFVNGAPAMNAAFEVQETRSWLRLRLVALGLLIGAGSLFLLSLLPSTGPDFVRNLKIPWLGLPERVPWYIEALFWLTALAVNVSMFALIYKILPNASTTWRQALVGGLVAGVLWELAKQGFSYYLAHFGNYNKVYGTLGGLIVLVLWIYYTSMILLLGAEAASLYRDLREATPAPGREPAGARPVPSPSGNRARA